LASLHNIQTQAYFPGSTYRHIDRVRKKRGHSFLCITSTNVDIVS